MPEAKELSSRIATCFDPFGDRIRAGQARLVLKQAGAVSEVCGDGEPLGSPYFGLAGLAEETKSKSAAWFARELPPIHTV